MSVLSIYPSVVIAGVINLLPLTAGIAFLENVPSFQLQVGASWVKQLEVDAGRPVAPLSAP